MARNIQKARLFALGAIQFDLDGKSGEAPLHGSFRPHGLSFEAELGYGLGFSTRDLRAYFDTIPRDWSITFLEHRIGDRRVIRLIRKWLNAGVMEGGSWMDAGNRTQDRP